MKIKSRLYRKIKRYLLSDLKQELRKPQLPDGYFNASLEIRDIKQDVVNSIMERENNRRMKTG